VSFQFAVGTYTPTAYELLATLSCVYTYMGIVGSDFGWVRLESELRRFFKASHEPGVAASWIRFSTCLNIRRSKGVLSRYIYR
jgi:hypothetical protein